MCAQVKIYNLYIWTVFLYYYFFYAKDTRTHAFYTKYFAGYCPLLSRVSHAKCISILVVLHVVIFVL